MGNDTISPKFSFASIREKAQNLLAKLHLIEPEEDDEESAEEEQRSYRARQTYIPRREVPTRTNRAQAPARRVPQKPAAGTRVPPAKENRARNPLTRKVDTAVFFVDSLPSCTHAIQAIIDGTSVIVHFVNTDRATSQRIIDTMSGAAFALDAKIKRVEDNTYLIAPHGVNINVVQAVEKRY